MAQVLTEEAAVPFATISGRETTTSDYKGIAMDLMQVGMFVRARQVNYSLFRNIASKMHSPPPPIKIPSAVWAVGLCVHS